MATVCETVCSECGSTVDVGSIDGFCGNCLLRNATGLTPGDEALNPAERDLLDIEFLGVIGTGAMGTVYRARQTFLNREVAVKVISPRLATNPEFIERFFREAQAMAQLNHPNIVSLHEVGESKSGSLYMVMELVEGENLQARIAEREVAVDDAVRWCIQLCHALDYAHGKGVVHRDIKPSNIIISKDGTAKLVDFGISVLVGGARDFTLTATGCRLGTPEYFPMEMLDGETESDHRGDLYSLGVTFYEMLTGTLPKGMWKWPSKTRPALDKRFDRIVDRALQNDPNARFQTASEFERELRKLLVKPSRVAGWIFAMGSAVIVSTSLFAFKKEPEKAYPPPGAVISLESNRKGERHPWDAEAVWGEGIPVAGPAAGEHDFVAERGTQLVTPIADANNNVTWPGKSLRLESEASLVLWGHESRIWIDRLVLAGGALSCANLPPVPASRYPEIAGSFAGDGWKMAVTLGGGVEVASASQIDYGVNSLHSFEIRSTLSGAGPLFVPPMIHLPGSLVLSGNNAEFRGPWTVMGRVRTESATPLGTGPVLVDGGRIEVGAAANLGDTRIENRGQIQLFAPTVFKSLSVGDVALAPGEYDADELVLEWTSLQAHASFTVLEVPPRNPFRGLLSDRSVPSTPFLPNVAMARKSPNSGETFFWDEARAWDNDPPVKPRRLRYVIPGGATVRDTTGAQGFRNFGGAWLTLDPDGKLLVDPIGSATVYPTLEFNGGSIANRGIRGTAAQIVWGGKMRVSADSTVDLRNPRAEQGTRLTLRGRVDGGANLTFLGGGNDAVNFGLESREFGGRWIFKDTILIPASDHALAESDIEIDGGALLADFRTVAHVDRLSLSNGAKIRMKAEIAHVRELTVDGVRVPEGVYENEPWIAKERKGPARVCVGPAIPDRFDILPPEERIRPRQPMERTELGASKDGVASR
ncbi:MAG: serine/threonine protein kinase [Akkermansiaceae bacterium]|nr:serine/threonine protein kinase [Akkermansiaceae bacterium]